MTIGSPSQETQPITIEDLRAWWRTSDNLGKPEAYKERIAQIANEFKTNGQPSPQALEAMQKDTVNRIAQIAYKLASSLGQRADDGTARVQGKVYDLVLNSQQKDLAIAHSKGDVILCVQSGQAQVNNLTPEVLQEFENANSKLDEILERNQKQATGLQR